MPPTTLRHRFQCVRNQDGWAHKEEHCGVALQPLKRKTRNAGEPERKQQNVWTIVDRQGLERGVTPEGLSWVGRLGLCGPLGATMCASAKASIELAAPGDFCEAQIVWTATGSPDSSYLSFGIMHRNCQINSFTQAIGIHSGTVGVVFGWDSAAPGKRMRGRVWKQGRADGQSVLAKERRRCRIKCTLCKDERDDRRVIIFELDGEVINKVRLPAYFEPPFYPCATLAERSVVLMLDAHSPQPQFCDSTAASDWVVENEQRTCH